MTRRRLTVLCLAALLLACCNRASGEAPGLKDAGPPIAKFAQAGKALDGLGAAVATTTGADRVPVGYEDRLRELGATARSVLSRAEPDGPAGVIAIEKELATAATDVTQHLVTSAGGTKDGPNRLLSGPPDQVAFMINVPARPLHSDRSDRGKIEARSRLKGDLSLEVEHFIYAALLANPAARTKLCTRCSPEALPNVVDRALNLPFTTREEWRRSLFDDGNHLVLPSPSDDRWVAFQAWAQAVNPTIFDAVHPLRQAAFDELYS